MTDKNLIGATVANFSGEMETRDHFKNGASLKSQTSRIYRNVSISMKKLFVAALVSAFMSGFASCSKNNECECTFSVLGVTARVERFEDTTKKECQEAEREGNAAGQGIVQVKCVVK